MILHPLAKVSVHPLAVPAADLTRIYQLLAARGYLADLELCTLLWHEWSADSATGWRSLPPADEDLWLILRTKAEQLSYHVEGIEL